MSSAWGERSAQSTSGLKGGQVFQRQRITGLGGFLCERQRRVRHIVADTRGNRKTKEKIASVSESLG